MLPFDVAYLADQQGWSPRTLLAVIGEFIKGKGLEDELLKWCSDIAEAENECSLPQQDIDQTSSEDTTSTTPPESGSDTVSDKS